MTSLDLHWTRMDIFFQREVLARDSLPAEFNFPGRFRGR